jgi:hypothetical protein
LLFVVAVVSVVVSLVAVPANAVLVYAMSFEQPSARLAPHRVSAFLASLSFVPVHFRLDAVTYPAGIARLANLAISDLVRVLRQDRLAMTPLDFHDGSSCFKAATRCR